MGIPEVVKLVGPVSPREVRAYFLATDLGVAPYEKSQARDHGMSLKVLEYSAARKMVVSTPLAEMETLHLPNVILAEREVDAWVDAITLARNRRWDERWIKHFEVFEWRRIAAQLAELVEELAREAETRRDGNVHVLSHG